MPVFECQMCGHCCEGRGGIVLGPRDLARLAEFMDLEEAELLAKYGEVSNGKWKIRTGDDGFCIFFQKGRGCAVHGGKPDICRAWPFFRGNLEDDASLAMAREFCPGIGKSVDFASFVRAGLEYLRANDLLAHDRRREANALILDGKE